MNDGFINERQIIAYLNNKKFSDVNSNFKAFLSFIFSNNINNDCVFIAKNCSGGIKPDLSISHNGITKYISVKKGTGNSVHQESIDVFFPFLEKLTNTTCLNHLKQFHYADDSYDDSGAKRYTASQAKSRYKKQIKELNSEINKKDILVKFIDRFLFYGNVSSISADYIYHGNLESGLWASKNEITEYIFKKTFNVNGVHFGPLTYQVWGRNHDRTAVHPDRRYVMQVKWGTLTKDLTSIRMEDKNGF